MKKALALLLVLGCEAHEGENIPLIHVVPGAAARIDMLHRGQPTAKPAVNPSRVHAMRGGEQLIGAGATGRVGNLVLENDEVVFVIAGGELVDAADAQTRIDELGGMIASFGAPGAKAVYVSHTSGVLEDGTAIVESKGYDHDDTSVLVRTRYTLHKTDRALLIETTVANSGKAPVTLPSLGDTVTWSPAEKFSADRGRAFTGASSGAFLGAVGQRASYALTSTEGALEASSTTTSSETAQQRQIVLAPGKDVSYARIFLVGPRADVSGLVAELTKAAGGEVGTLRLWFTADGAMVKIPDAVVEIDDAAGHPIMDLRGDAAGEVTTEVPVGKYQVRLLRGGGRTMLGNPGVIEIAAGGVVPVTLNVTGIDGGP